MDADPFDLVGDLIDGQFRVDAFAGEGDLSVVYRGWHEGVAATVAIKCLNLPATLDPELVEPFVKSFREGTKLHYRLARKSLHIAQSLASGTTLAPRTGQLVPYLVREWFEGQSLAATFAERRAKGLRGYTLEETLALLGGAADGLAYAHGEDVTHHSINPSNLFVVDSGGKPAVKLLDFGVAKVMNEQGGRSAGLRVLMPEYAAPEQIDSQIGAVGPWTDVYALALVVMEALAGKALFESKEGAPAAQIDPKQRPSLRSHGVTVRRAVEEVLGRAVALDPAKRPPHAASFWSALKTAAAPPAVVLSHAPPANASAQPSKAPPPRPHSVAPRPLRAAISNAPAAPVPTIPPPPPRNPLIARKTIAGLGGEMLPMFPVPSPVEPLGTLPNAAPSPTAQPSTASRAPVTEALAPRDPAPTDIDPEDPAEVLARRVSKPSFAPAAGVRKLRSLVLVAVGGSAVALFALVALTLYVMRHVHAEEPSNLASSAPTASTVPSATANEIPVASVAPAAPAPPPIVVAKHFTRAAGIAALDGVNGGLATCAREGGHTGTGSVRVTFSNDGSVMHVSIGRPFDGTPEGTCVVDRFRGARVGPFGGPVGALNYNFTVVP